LNFDFPGYDLRFIQKSKCRDETSHLCTYIFKFFSPVTDYHYVIRAEYHLQDVFAVKFYCKKDRKSDYKYSKIVNRGDLGNIIMSCAKVIPLLLQMHPTASFSFAASRSVDFKNNSIEDYGQTQRFRLYQYMIPLKFGTKTFIHYAYPAVSSYLLYNRSSEWSKDEIESMFRATYTDLSEINL
jgi:hypothetical protein